MTNLVWIGTLKFQKYEMENIKPLVTSSPLFSSVVKKLGEKRTAQLIGVTEIVIGSLIAAKPFAPRASAVGSMAAIGMFLTTLSFAEAQAPLTKLERTLARPALASSSSPLCPGLSG